MIHSIYPIQVPGSLPESKLITYIQDDTPEIGIEHRPLILICPGGGYSRTSDREAESMALQFLAMGYHTAVLRYSCAPAKYPTALMELATAVAFIRKHAAEWHIDADKIIVQGCSAGGHLAACLGMFWHERFLYEGIGLNEQTRELVKPNAMLLCYPLITSGEYAHKNSFEKLLGTVEEGTDRSNRERMMEKLSLEKQVSDKTPPTFIWHTVEDQVVPVENSLLLVNALRKKGISTEFHMYPKGGHGLSLANRLTATAAGGGVREECSSWIGLAHTWIELL